MNVFNVLMDSLRLLRKRPQLFIPKLFSATVSSVWLIVMTELIRTGKFRLLLISYGLTMPVIMLLGVFVPLMTAEMIRDREREDLLTYSFYETLKHWKKILGIVLLLFIASIFSAAPAAVGSMLTLVSGSIAGAILGLSASLAIILALSFLIYFLPISVITEEKLIKGLESSVNTSMNNRREVGLLMVFSFSLFVLAVVAQGALRSLGFAAFIMGRLLSATVTTYTFIVSPNYYLKEKKSAEENSNKEEKPEKED